MNLYEEKKQRRIERLKALAKKRQEESNSVYERSVKSLSGLGMGQPILIGHHSETRHRNLLKNANRMTAKSIELFNESENLAARAFAAECNTAISSDDPQAIVKLEERIAKLSTLQEKMKAVNKAIKAKKSLTDLGLGIDENDAKKLSTKNQFGYVGFPRFELSNNNANMIRLKKRLEYLKKTQAIPTMAPISQNGIEIRDSAETNRIQIYFPGKPPQATIEHLKSNGFRWSPSQKCWQRMRSNWALNLAKTIISKPI